MNILISKEMTVDSVTIAQQCGVEHESAIRLLSTHSDKIEGRVGPVRFEIGVGKPLPQGGFGAAPKIAHLTEEQAMVLITLFRNTPKVVDFKLALVVAFVEARRMLREGNNPRLASFRDIFTEIKGLGVSNDMAADVARSLSWGGGRARSGGKSHQPAASAFEADTDNAFELLKKHGPIRRTEFVQVLIDETGVSRPTAYRLIGRLDRKGKVHRGDSGRNPVMSAIDITTDFAVTP